MRHSLVTLLAIANFVGTPFDVTGKTVMATILFMLYGLFFSMMNCSYGAMVPAITKNRRTRLTGGMASGRRYAGPAAVHGGIRASYESYRR
ncbi:hypothetical protein ACULNC_01815 [Shigella flexneri]